MPTPPGPASPFANPELIPGASRPIPSEPRRRWLLGTVTVILLAAVVALQRPGEPDPTIAKRAQEAAKVEPPRMDPMILLGKVLLAFGDQGGPEFKVLLREQVDTPMFGEPGAADQVRAVMLLIGTGAANVKPDAGVAPVPWPGMESPVKQRPLEQVLDDVEKNLAAESPLHDDITALRPLLSAAEAAGATEKDVRAALASLTEPARQGLSARHGWFADVLLSAGDPQAPVRVRSASEGLVFVGIMVLVGLAVFGAFIAGLVLLILGLVRRSRGLLRSSFAPAQRAVESDEDPARAAWVRGLWHETVAVFLLGFLALKLAQVALAELFPKADWIVWVALLGQWLLVVCIFWPVIRGLSMAEWKERIGWRAPRGVAREVGAGLCAYLASLPIYFGMAVVVVVLMLIMQAIQQAAGGKPVQPQGNRITEIISEGGPAVLVMVFFLATVWAPVVEESIFRGALYRHLRGRFGLLGAASLSAAVFALMHGYLLIQLLMVFTLGFVFAVMREWRNSLIPSATAHALHNGLVMSLMLTAAWFMRG